MHGLGFYGNICDICLWQYLIGTLRKELAKSLIELAKLQQELAEAHNQVCYWKKATTVSI